MKYFDYAATTPVSEEALETYVDVSRSHFTNPGSDENARKFEEEIRHKILKTLNIGLDYNLIFTSGGTEANNLAIKGIIKNRFKKGSHFITSSFEHASIYEVFTQFEKGNKVTYVPSTKFGYVDVEKLKRSLRPDTKFVSIMQVNNELGTIQPIEQLYKITKEYNPNIVFMVDAVQALGKMEPLSIIPDVITISSHKIYGPKAVGAIIVKKKLKLRQQIFGGTKEAGQRAGTQSLPAQAGFCVSVEVACKNLKANLEKIEELRTYLENKITEIPKTSLNAKSDTNVVSIFIDIDLTSKKIINLMKEKGFMISAKSADSNDAHAKSRTLKSIGLSDYRCDRTCRISLSHTQTFEDIDQLVEAFKQIVEHSETANFKLIKNKTEFEKYLMLRREVFSGEDKVLKNLQEDELDTLQGPTLHFGLFKNGEIIGTCRVRDDDYQLFIERVSIKREFQNQGYGTLMVQRLCEAFKDSDKDFYIEAISQRVRFYNSLGFVKYGVEFEKFGVEHIKMLKQHTKKS